MGWRRCLEVREECRECTSDQKWRRSAESIEVIRGQGGVQGI